MYTYYEKKNILINFYNNLKFKGFKTITPERKKDLDEIVLKWHPSFQELCLSGLDLMSYVARRLVFSASFYGLFNGDEKAYFFIQMVDPDLLALECYECANTRKELEDYLRINSLYYNKTLIVLEKYYNNYFKKFNPDEIWTLERIKKS